MLRDWIGRASHDQCHCRSTIQHMICPVSMISPVNFPFVNSIVNNWISVVFFFSVDWNIIDWSKKGRIAASFDCDLVLWGPPTSCNQPKTTEVFKFGHIKSLAFSPSGEYLALGVEKVHTAEPNIRTPELQILRINVVTDRCGRISFREANDEIRAISWDPAGKHIVW